MIDRLIALIWPLAPATLWGLTAAVPAVLNEYLYRMWGSPISWWFPIFLGCQLTIGYSIFRLVSIPQQSLLDSFMFWAFSTTFMRVFVSTVLLQENVKPGTWFALGLLLMARIAQTFWGR